MRLENQGKLTDHDLLQNQNPESHHPPGEHFRILINSQSIPGVSAWEHRVTLTYDGHNAIRAVLRGFQLTDIQGHTGLFCMGTDVSGDCTSVGIKPYGSGGYPTTYMGGYSRIHGDAYLSPPMFGGQVRLRDVWIDGDEAVFEFYNAMATSRTMSCYGAVQVK